MTEADRSAEALVEQRLKEAYFTASQTQLIWARFRKNRSAMVAGAVLILLILMGLGAPFLSPYEPTIAGRDKDYQFGAPQIPMFCDHNGCSLRPFLHTLERTRSIETNFRWVTEVNTEKRRYVHFFVPGWKYRIFAVELDLPGKAFDIRTRGLEFETHLFGVDEGGIHIFGTDSAGKDIFSRTLHAIWTSLAVGTIGMLIGFVLALIVGGVSGYFGGHIDGALQMVTDAVRTVPTIPLFMALAAFVPDEWSSETRFFFISIILGLVGWPTLARRIRTHLLTERKPGVRARGAALRRLLRARHPASPASELHELHHRGPRDLVPLHGALGETALSFIGLGLKEPVNSLGVLLQSVTKLRCAAQLPVALHFRRSSSSRSCSPSCSWGTGCEDAADPYSDRHR